MKTTFYFNTGVRPYSHTPPVPLSPGHIMRGGTMQIPFECEDVPAGAVFAFACDESEGKNGMLVREIHNSAMISKYAHFTPPIEKEHPYVTKSRRDGEKGATVWK